jgi:uncharacterized protein YecE (DUF72 family)
VNERTPGRCHVGTSGWHYPHWRGRFYPPDLGPRDYLGFYAERFGTVEVNSTFYRLPTAAAVGTWARETPPGFVFACKASRGITHMKKLKDPAATLGPFLERMAVLADKLGPLLFQLPPNWRPNPARLADFLEALPANRRAVFELRDRRWHRADIYDLLSRHNRAFCIFDLAGQLSPLEITADFVYIRLHGPAEAYRGGYGPTALADWAERIADWRAEGRDVYCYFDNDAEAQAIADARALTDRLAALDEASGVVGSRSTGGD